MNKTQGGSLKTQTTTSSQIDQEGIKGDKIIKLGVHRSKKNYEGILCTRARLAAWLKWRNS